MAGDLVRQAIVLALGAGALGGPDALRLLLQFTGRNPAVDLAVCVIVISLLTVPVLGAMLLARFVRKARAVPGGGAPVATDLFAQVTATVSVGAAFLVTACLLAVPGGGGGLGGVVSLPIHFAAKNSNVVTVLTICVVVISLVTALLLGIMQLARFFRKLRRAGGGGGAAPAATDLFAQMTTVVSVGAVFLVIVCLLVMPGGGGVRLLFDFAVKNSNVVTVLTICAGFTAGGFLPCAVHMLRFFRGPGSSGGPAPAGRCTTTIKFVAVAATSLVASLVAFTSGGFEFDGHLLFPEFHWGRSMVTTMPVGFAIVTVAGTTVLARCLRRAA